MRAGSRRWRPWSAAALAGEPTDDDIAVVNLNQRSLVADEGRGGVPVFDRVLAQLTSERLLGGLRGLRPGQDLLRPAQRPDVRASERRPEDHQAAPRAATGSSIYAANCTLRCATCAQRWRSCLPRAGTARRSTSCTARVTPREILSSFYFNSWLGTPDTADRLLRQLRELDVAPSRAGA